MAEDENKGELAERPRKAKNAPFVRDGDGARQIDYSRVKDGNIYQERAQKVIDGVVRDIFFRKDGSSFWVNPNGRLVGLPKYDTPEALAAAIVRWEEEVYEKIQQGVPVIPDAEYLCASLGIAMSTMRDWRSGRRGDAFKAVVEVELNKIAAVKNQIAMSGGLPPIVWATMMNNVHGYTQNQKVDVQITARTVPSKEELIDRANLLPG